MQKKSDSFTELSNCPSLHETLLVLPAKVLHPRTPLHPGLTKTAIEPVPKCPNRSTQKTFQAGLCTFQEATRATLSFPEDPDSSHLHSPAAAGQSTGLGSLEGPQDSWQAQGMPFITHPRVRSPASYKSLFESHGL